MYRTSLFKFTSAMFNCHVRIVLVQVKTLQFLYPLNISQTCVNLPNYSKIIDLDGGP